ncbi:phage tail sheath family protein [Mahella australiensis]|uniref:Phage tail sheath protein n=1 Tax=Mahella australiensis (strain DSM 15567 / CIP 107919 / 50-1 BON) TaxID=697281 RepID=F3ZZH4_MAHA5|nr:phage tail sheath family protein [Mahella australiensis]AEE95784.1 hypothetical protein Mahau_0581 [Mahella australiensis 50-1 BON]
MAGGTWTASEPKVRPGFYINFQAAATAQIGGGPRGIVVMPVKANWGPVRQFVEITNEKELVDAYTASAANGATAYTEIRFALLGAPRKVLGYRLADASAAKASITLKDTAATPANVLTLTTKYETDRPFKVTVRENVVDANKYDIVLHEDTVLLYVFTFDKGASVADNAVAAINNDAGNKWITAAKVAAGNGSLALVSSQPFAGGNSGISGITNTDYTNALTEFEGITFNVLTLDGISDSSLQASIKEWVDRVRNDGKKALAVVGGSADDDQDVAAGNARSAGFNHEAIVNVTVGGMLDGISYSSAEIAPYIAGLIAGQKLNESITYHVTPFEDVTKKLTNSEVIASLQAGSLVLVNDGEKVIIEQGINTLTSLSEDQNNQWKKIRAIRVMDAINDDLLKAARDSYIGKVTNNDDGKVALISACKQYMEKLAADDVIMPDFTVQIDPQYHGEPPIAAPDEVYLYWEAAITDSMEKIYSTFIVR